MKRSDKAIIQVFLSLRLVYMELDSRAQIIFSEENQENLVFQQLGSMEKCCKLHHWGFGAKMLSKYMIIVNSLILLGQDISELSKLKCKQKHPGFPRRQKLQYKESFDLRISQKVA